MSSQVSQLQRAELRSLMEGRQGSTVCLKQVLTIETHTHIERQEAPDIIGHRNLKRLVRLERKYLITVGNAPDGALIF